jgi:hypothetical protein
MPFCEKCGTEHLEGVSFCRTCGTSLGRGTEKPPAATPPPQQPPAYVPQRHRPWLLWAVPAALVLILALGLGLGLGLRHDPDRPEVTLPTTPDTQPNIADLWGQDRAPYITIYNQISDALTTLAGKIGSLSQMPAASWSDTLIPDVEQIIGLVDSLPDAPLEVLLTQETFRSAALDLLTALDWFSQDASTDNWTYCNDSIQEMNTAGQAWYEAITGN